MSENTLISIAISCAFILGGFFGYVVAVSTPRQTRCALEAREERNQALLLERRRREELDSVRELLRRFKWIPWGERMPNPNVRVLIAYYGPKGLCVTPAAWSGVNWFDGEDQIERIQSTHWMYLPDPPSEAVLSPSPEVKK